MGTRIQSAARSAALNMVNAAVAKRKWTAAEKNHWTRAVNALQRLAGKKFRFTVTAEGVRPYTTRSPSGR